MDSKACSKCREIKPFSDFAKEKNGVNGIRGDCKSCVSKRVKKYYRANREVLTAKARKYHKENPEKTADRNRKSLLRRHYGLTTEEYNKMLKAQNGVCAVCKVKETDTFKGEVKRLAVDHCHDTGEVRDLLCGGCNRGMGQFKDNIELLEAAIVYLRHHKERKK